LTLFEELLELLSADVVIETFQETEKLFHLLVRIYPATRWGRIDWNFIPEKYSVVSVNDAVDNRVFS